MSIDHYYNFCINFSIFVPSASASASVFGRRPKFLHLWLRPSASAKKLTFGRSLLPIQSKHHIVISKMICTLAYLIIVQQNLMFSLKNHYIFLIGFRFRGTLFSSRTLSWFDKFSLFGEFKHYLREWTPFENLPMHGRLY